jgi:hypothetical protein
MRDVICDQRCCEHDCLHDETDMVSSISDCRI